MFISSALGQIGFVTHVSLKASFQEPIDDVSEDSLYRKDLSYF